MATNTPAPSPETSITIKVILNGKDENRKFRLPLKDLGANSLPDKVRSTVPLQPCLGEQPENTLIGYSFMIVLCIARWLINIFYKASQLALYPLKQGRRLRALLG